VKAPLERGPAQNAGGMSGACNGTLTLDWNQFIATHPSSLGSPFQGGENVCAQGWFRDPPTAKTTAMSDGLVFTVAP
jgi:hypothetical protein